MNVKFTTVDRKAYFKKYEEMSISGYKIPGENRFQSEIAGNFIEVKPGMFIHTKNIDYIEVLGDY